jgi:hypothetical protein
MYAMKLKDFAVSIKSIFLIRRINDPTYLCLRYWYKAAFHVLVFVDTKCDSISFQLIEVIR